MTVHPNGVALSLGSDTDNAVTARLVLDCMGHGSPAVRQLRWGHKPDGVCLVVGTCASGFQDNTHCALCILVITCVRHWLLRFWPV